MYEPGISFEWDDERTGAASLWMVPTSKIGVADASSGNNERVRSDLIVKLMIKLCTICGDRNNCRRKGRKRRRVDEMRDGGWWVNEEGGASGIGFCCCSGGAVTTAT